MADFTLVSSPEHVEVDRSFFFVFVGERSAGFIRKHRSERRWEAFVPFKGAGNNPYATADCTFTTGETFRRVGKYATKAAAAATVVRGYHL